METNQILKVNKMNIQMYLIKYLKSQRKEKEGIRIRIRNNIMNKKHLIKQMMKTSMILNKNNERK